MGNSRAQSKKLPTIRVLADSDLILEFFINREGFVEDAEMLFRQIEQQSKLQVYITDKCLKRIGLEDELGEDAASSVENIFYDRVIKIDGSIRANARKSCLRDYDSAEEVACIKTKLLDAIVTENPENFKGEDLQVWSITSLSIRLQLELARQFQVLYKNSLNEGIEETHRLTEVFGTDKRLIDNSKSTSKTTRKFTVSREWSKTYSVQYENTKSNGTEFNLKLGVSELEFASVKETFEKTLKTAYSVSEVETETYTEKVQIEISERKKVNLILTWKHIWQHGFMKFGYQSKEFDIPFKVAVGVTFDQTQIDE